MSRTISSFIRLSPITLELKGLLAFAEVSTGNACVSFIRAGPSAWTCEGYTENALRERNLAKIGILVIENDEANQTVLRQLLDSEGWQVRIVPAVNQAMAELSTGEWSLVIVNVAMIGLTSPVYLTLRELALAPAVEDGRVRARVLFVVPESAALEALPVFEKERLPYVVKPFHFHDLLEKVSDLLMEAAALADPIRRVRHDAGLSERKRKEGRASRESGRGITSRNTGMFAKREEYSMTEEEIAEYEKSEKEEREKKKKKIGETRY
jgi:DNA-binding response OmpR family regulator